MSTVVVQARRDGGRRRGGRHWPNTPVQVDVSEELLALLKSDPELLVRLPREHEHATAVDGDTVESLRAELAELQRQLAESRAAHAADAQALTASVAYVETLEAELASARAAHTSAAALANETVEKWSAATAENDALRKQIAALEEAATAPAQPPKKSAK